MSKISEQKNKFPLYVVALGTSAVLKTFEYSLLNSIRFLDGENTLFSPREFRQGIRKVKLALGLLEEHLNKAYGTDDAPFKTGSNSHLWRKAIERKREYPRVTSFTEACPDWPEGKEEDPNYPVSDEEE
jgi:hypothetical protein